jgi:hypothetical protein
VAGTGDFYDDGKSDILWQNTDGQLGIWEINEINGAFTPGKEALVVQNPGSDWNVVGTGDFSGDGFSDCILFQNNTNGQAAIWKMNGGDPTVESLVGPAAGLSWEIKV